LKRLRKAKYHFYLIYRINTLYKCFGDARQKPTYKDLQEMKYLERAVKEVLRLYPSVHFISRKLGDDLITGSGYKLPKGTITHLHVYDLHHNPDIYPDPERFDPDRFFPENCQNRHPSLIYRSAQDPGTV
jgi:cytochrome P450 family 4